MASLPAFILRTGPRWTNGSVRWAVRQLTHRGKPSLIARRERTRGSGGTGTRESKGWRLTEWLMPGGGWVLLGYGEAPLETDQNGIRVWTWGINPAGHAAVTAAARGGNLPVEFSVRFAKGLILVLRENRGVTVADTEVEEAKRDPGALGNSTNEAAASVAPNPAYVEVLRGDECDATVRFAQAGRSLFIAPEGKAIRRARGAGPIGSLEKGDALRFDPGAPGVEIEPGPKESPALPTTDLSYEACQREVDRMLHEEMAAIRRRYQAEGRGTLAIALSGGLDSCLAAWLAAQTGMTCEAFTVYCDAGEGEPPPDLVGARQTAQALGIPLHELRIGPENMKALTREAVYLLEESSWRRVENGALNLRLVQALKQRGYDEVMTGGAADELFAGRVFPSQLERGLQRALENFRRLPFAIVDLTSMHGIRLISPMSHPGLRPLALSLPEAYQVDRVDGKVWGKKLLRELYGEKLMTPLLDVPKDFPFNTSGIEALYRSQWGTRKKRERRYARWLDELVERPAQRWTVWKD